MTYSLLTINIYIQIAQAIEKGASGVLLITAVVGNDLETLLNSCTIMGVEALVEVHTPNELEFALAQGATLFLVNNWDRLSGKLFPDQVALHFIFIYIYFI